MSVVPRLVNTKEEIIEAVYEFNSAGSNLRNLIGNFPRYFICILVDGKYLFGLSKFVAFYNITTESYISIHRYQRNGGNTQKRLVKVTCQNWISYDKNTEAVKKAFQSWMHTFNSIYEVKKANFIILNNIELGIPSKRTITQDDFDKIIEKRLVIGEIGEQIAYQYEINRLSELGCKDAMIVKHTSKVDVGAGHDIYSECVNDIRFIEVKTSTINNDSFYLTASELEAAQRNNVNFYIYIVHVTDIPQRIGSVVRIIKDPYEKLELVPLVYLATIK